MLKNNVYARHINTLFTAKVSTLLQYFAESYEESRFLRLLLLCVVVLFLISPFFSTSCDHDSTIIYN